EPAQAAERVARDPAVADELGQTHLEVTGQQPRGALELLGEAGAPPVEDGEDRPGVRRALPLLRLERRESLPHLDVLAQDQADRRGADRRVAGPPEAPPRDLPREGEMVERVGAEVAKAGAQERRLPLRRRGLEPRQLAHDLVEAARAVE